MIAFLFLLQKETEGPHRAGGRTSWTCGAPGWRKTPYVVQGARASLRDLALQLSILRRIPSRQVARGFPFAGREYSRWRRGLVKEILSATHSDQCAVRHIRTCTSKALLDGIDVRLGSSTNCQVSFCFPTQAESCVGRSLPLVSPKCRPSFRHLLDQGLTCVTDCLFAHELCCVRCWCRPRSPSRSPLPGAVARRPSAATCNLVGTCPGRAQGQEDGEGLSDPRAHLQGGIRTRGLEAGRQRALRAVSLLSDLPLFGRAGSQDQDRRPPGAGGLLHHHARPDESEFEPISRDQYRLPECVRPCERPHRLVPHDPRRLLIGRLLRHDRRADGEIYALAAKHSSGARRHSSCRPIRSA